MGVSQLIIATIALFGILNIVSVWFFSRSMLQGLLLRVNELDSTIAEAIKTVLAGNFDLPEPPSPFQQILMGMIQDKMKGNQEKIPNIELVRDKKGKFS